MELVYFRAFRLLLKGRYLRARTRYIRPTYRVFLQPNFLLTTKSKNSRMGSGVGVFLRLVIKLSAGQVFLEFRGHSRLWVSRIYNFIKFKLPYKCFVVV